MNTEKKTKEQIEEIKLDSVLWAMNQVIQEREEEQAKKEENQNNMSNIPIMGKEYYKEIVIDYLKEHKKTLTEKEIQEIAEYRSTTFVERMQESKNLMMDKEFFYQEMLEF